jgi:hypothetical protein
LKKKKLETKTEETTHHSKISWAVFLTTLIISLISLFSVVFPALISDTVVPNGFDMLGLESYDIDPYETGPLAELLIFSNVIVFGLYFFRKRIPKISKIFSFDIPQKISIVIVLIVIVAYGSISFPEVYTDEIYQDFSQVKIAIDEFDLSKINGQGPHLRWFLLDQSMILFGSYKVIPLLSSMALLGITYLFTTSLTKNRFSGLVSMGLVLQSYIFFTFDTSSTYTSFWILLYVTSLYVIVRFSFANPVFYLGSIFCKALTALFAPQSIFFILNSQIPKKHKIILSGIIISVLTIGVAGMGKGMIEDPNMAEFWVGFATFAFQTRFDVIMVLFLVPLVFGLFVKSKENKHANSISFLIAGALFSAPLLTGLTDQTNQPYRLMPMVVFFAIGVGMLFSKVTLKVTAKI